MLVLDTDTLTLLIAGHPRVGEKRLSLPGTEVAITVVTRIEVLQGRFAYLLKAADAGALLRAQQLLDFADRDLDQIENILPVDDRAAKEFERLRQDRKLKKIGRADLLIAAITLAHRATLVTRNLRHFRLVHGLLLENWAD